MKQIDLPNAINEKSEQLNHMNLYGKPNFRIMSKIEKF